MNKQEAIKRIESMGEYEAFVDESISKKSVLNIINQINEPEKPVIPQFVADWIEECKTLGRSLRDSMKNTKVPTDVNVWLMKLGQKMFTYPNQSTFARAWLDGYEVEKEKRYRVTIPNPDDSNLMLFKLRGTTRIFFEKASYEDKIGFDSKLTEKEIRDHGCGWVFDCKGAKVKEVEE